MTSDTPAAILRHIVDRLVLLLEGRRSPHGIHQPRTLNVPALNLVRWTMRRVVARFLAVLARIEAGTLRRPPTRSPDAPPRKPPATTKPRLEWPYRLRSTPGWLMRLNEPKHHMAGLGDELRCLLKDAEMHALLAQAPQLRRILRPLLVMMGTEPPSEPATEKPRRRSQHWYFLYDPPPPKNTFPPGFIPPPIPKTA